MFKWLKRLFYSVPFGLKGAEIDALAQKSSSLSENEGVYQMIQSNRLADALLRGEMNQEVEELRYRDYTVSNESKKYEYLGDGTAVKRDEVIRDYDNFSFSQDNGIICNGILDEIKRVGEQTIEEYTFTILYDTIPRFRLEKFCKLGDVTINDGIPHIALHFSSLADKYDKSTQPFINELNKIITNKTYYMKNHDFCNSLLRFSFVTYKAYGEDDLIRYEFNDLSCIDIIKDNLEFIIIYKAKTYSRENLIAKFYSETMAKKYENHEQKRLEYNMVDEMRIEKCDICGKEMHVYDADITRATYNQAICIECLEKMITDEYLELDN